MNAVSINEEMIENYISPEDCKIINLLKQNGITTTQQVDELFEPSLFIVVPSNIVKRDDLNAPDKIIYGLLCGLVRKSGYCYATNNYLSKFSGIPHRTMRRTLQNLFDKKLINIDINHKDSGTWRKITVCYDKGGGQIGQGDGQNGHGGVPKMATHKINRQSINNTNVLELHSKGEGDISFKEPKQPKPLTDLQRVVLTWKQLEGFHKDDKTWNKVHFARCSAAAKKLIDLFDGNALKSVVAMENIINGFRKKNLSYTLETVIKYVPEYLKSREDYNEIA